MNNSQFCSCEGPLILSSPYHYHFAFLWNWNCCDYALFKSLFIGQNHRWRSHLKFGKTIEKPSMSMVNLGKNIQWWWSGGSKTIEKPSKAMVPRKKNITIPSSWKNYHRRSLNPYIFFFRCASISWIGYDTDGVNNFSRLQIMRYLDFE